MIAPEMDAEPFFKILHGLIRQDASVEETDRSNLVMDWLQRARYTVERVCDKKETSLLGATVGYWTNFRVCPSRELLESQVRSTPKSKEMLDLLAAYDQYSVSFKPIDHLESEYWLSRRIINYEQCKLIQILDNAKQIAAGSVADPRSTPGNELPPLSGTKDSLGFLMERFQKGILVNDARTDGGLVAEHTGDLRKVYDEHRAARLSGMLWIPTGIPAIDNHMGGLRRKEMVGVLGYTGQRKSAVVRTMAYNAAAAGFNVLHIPLESDFVEELSSYSVMHAYATRNPKLTELTRRRFDSGDLTDAEYAEFMDTTVPDFGVKVGSNLTIYDPKAARNWPAIKGIIERENFIKQLDLVIVDYLTLIGDPASRDQVVAKTLMIQDGKQFALNGGFCLVTPIQGSRKGYEEAGEKDGAWDLTGISTFSEYDKSLDTCLYVFTNEFISTQGQLKIGSCKHRRGADIPATLVPIDNNSGMLSISASDAVGTEINITQAPPRPPTPAEAGTFFGFMSMR